MQKTREMRQKTREMRQGPIRRGEDRWREKTGGGESNESRELGGRGRGRREGGTWARREEGDKMRGT